jgi:hypothetical protein
MQSDVAYIKQLAMADFNHCEAQLQALQYSSEYSEQEKNTIAHYLKARKSRADHLYNNPRK